MFVESLEGRRLLAAGATFDPATETLYVAGTNGPDEITVSYGFDGFRGVVNGRSFVYITAGVDAVPINNLVIDSFGGDDYIDYWNDRNGPYNAPHTLIRAGAGNDVVEAQSVTVLNLQIEGGAGNDSIYLDYFWCYRGNGAVLLGGNGDDTIDVYGSAYSQSTFVDGGNGKDWIKAVTWCGSQGEIPATCYGGNGNDALIGRADDLLDGGNGNNTIARE